mmetsp:Transcript_44264/g.123104  ORF Transcript_44264/g.123104 Transcript_44264/m.123104 type:complete len:212 (+) Transcript_44264:1313-1948(+)
MTFGLNLGSEGGPFASCPSVAGSAGSVGGATPASSCAAPRRAFVAAVARTAPRIRSSAEPPDSVLSVGGPLVPPSAAAFARRKASAASGIGACAVPRRDATTVACCFSAMMLRAATANIGDCVRSPDCALLNRDLSSSSNWQPGSTVVSSCCCSSSPTSPSCTIGRTGETPHTDACAKTLECSGLKGGTNTHPSAAAGAPARAFARVGAQA